MVLPQSTTDLTNSLGQYTDIISWINDTLDADDDGELTELDEQITQLLATLDIACEDTSSQLENIIEEVSRSVPRVTYDLHFMKDSAMSSQTSVAKVLQQSKEAISDSTKVALDHLRQLDLIKRRMEAAREALQEAESWGSLELEVTSLLAERSYAKAAERLSEANRSMVVFQNTPEYESRRTLMVNLQNQLEASLSTALVAAINAQDMTICQSYFFIFSQIQRESEFRNYYDASRRAPIVDLWRDVSLADCFSSTSSTASTETFSDFLVKFFNSFLSLIQAELVSIPSIFPDPAVTMSSFISSTLSSLQPTFSQRLSSLSEHHGETSLEHLILVYKLTEGFAVDVEKVMEKMNHPESGGGDRNFPQQSKSASSVRRRSTRMSISWRPGTQVSSSTPMESLIPDVMEWNRELFQPFLNFQIDYGTQESIFLEYTLRQIIIKDMNEKAQDVDRARLLKERAMAVISAAEESLSRCNIFTHGYGSMGLVQALDNFFKSFINIWTADVRLETRDLDSQLRTVTSSNDLSSMDYTGQDWSDFQLLLHLLSSARVVFERISNFETKLRSSLAQTAIRFRLARNDPVNFTIAPSRGEDQLLEQSSLNSAELHALLDSVETEKQSRESSLPSSRHLPLLVTHEPSEPLLVEARLGVFSFANSCQVSLQTTILSPLRKHLASYASLPLWSATGDPRSRHTLAANDLQMPTFSLSPSDTIQRVAEGLLNLPRLFEIYADDDALAFSLHTLPHLDLETVKGLPDQASLEVFPQSTQSRRSSLVVTKPVLTDPDAVSSAWLSSLGHILLIHFTTEILPNIQSLSMTGSAQLVSDLEYLSNIVRAINVEFAELNQWKELVELSDDDGRKRFSDVNPTDGVLRTVAKLRGWDK